MGHNWACSPGSMADEKTARLLQTCWNACWQVARRPVEGVLVAEDRAREALERVLRNLAMDYEELPAEAEFTARALQESREALREIVAGERREASDPQLHHDPEDRRYEKNLDLDRLQKHHPERGFSDREWNRLPPVLKPLAFARLSKKGIQGADAEDVFSDTLVELVREREGGKGTPILDVTVFEEIVPLHMRIVGFRAVDWYRRRGALKNQPNVGDSYDEMTDDPDRPVQFADPGSEDDAPMGFEQIYAECEEALDPDEWDLVFRLFVAQSATVTDLVRDDEFCATLPIKPGASGSTRRRAIEERVEGALEKLRNVMEN
jgi:hypothetical protein